MAIEDPLAIMGKMANMANQANQDIEEVRENGEKMVPKENQENMAKKVILAQLEVKALKVLFYITPQY